MRDSVKPLKGIRDICTCSLCSAVSKGIDVHISISLAPLQAEYLTESIGSYAYDSDGGYEILQGPILGSHAQVRDSSLASLDDALYAESELLLLQSHSTRLC